MPAFARAVLAAIPLAILTAPAWAEQQSYDLPPFSAIDIATGIKANVVQAGERSVVATGVQSDLDDLKLEVRDGTLHAFIDRNFMEFLVEGGLLGEFFGSDEGVSLEIGMPRLDAATASSGALVTVGAFRGTEAFAAGASSGAHVVIQNVETGDAKLDASSGASVRASGHCDTLEADASSGAHIEATGLACTDAVADASSGASVGLTATGTVEAHASSGAHVNVSGSPADVDTDESFGGSVTVN